MRKWDGYDVFMAALGGILLGGCLIGTIVVYPKNQTIARLEAERGLPPENYFGDTVHFECIWTAPEKAAVEKYPGYRAIGVEKLKEAYWVTLVWNGKQ